MGDPKACEAFEAKLAWVESELAKPVDPEPEEPRNP